MEKDEIVATFFSRIPQIRDQLLAIGDKVEDDDLMQTMFDGLPTTWETFLASLYGRGIQPNFERMWHDCLDEESRIQSRSGPPPEKESSSSRQNKERKESLTKQGQH